MHDRNIFRMASLCPELDTVPGRKKQQQRSGTTKTTARKQHNNNTKSKIKIQDHTRLVESGLNHRHRRQRQYAAKERAAGGQGEEWRKQKAPERHRQGGTGKGLEAKGVKPRHLLDLGGARSSKSHDQCGDLRAPRRSHPTAPAASCRTHTNSVAPISLSVPTSRFRSTPKWGLAYSTSAGVGECPLTVADRQGQVAHTRGSGETVATSPSDEEQMAIIFRCSILGDSLLALKRRRNPVRLDFIDLM